MHNEAGSFLQEINYRAKINGRISHFCLTTRELHFFNLCWELYFWRPNY